MKSRFYSADISPEFLINSVVSLGDDFIGIVYEATAKTRSPSSCTSTALAPPIHTFSIKRHLRMMLVYFGKVDMLGLSI